MTNRRQFLRNSIAASALPLAAHAAHAAGIRLDTDPAEPAVPLYKIIYDTRFEASVVFAHRAAALGVATHAIDGDMTRFWYDDLYHRWQSAPVAIAGLTAHGPLFCLERLAWDQRMRVVFRAEHRFDDTAGVTHGISGPESMLRIVGESATGRDWSAAMADVVTRCPAGRAAIATCEVRAAFTSADRHAPEPLYSWIIAPVNAPSATAI